MSKLNIGQNVGYTKSKNDSIPENYPNTIVEAVYWDEKKKPLNEILSDSESKTEELEDKKLNAPTAAGSAGQVLALDANGKSSWVDAATGGVYDGALSDSSTNAPQNKVVTAELTALGQKVGKMQVQWVNGFYVKTNGTLGTAIPASSTDAGWNYARFPVEFGDVITINGHGGETPRIWAFADSAGNLLSRSSSGVTASNLVITAPCGAKECILNSDVTTIPSYYIGTSSNEARVDSLEKTRKELTAPYDMLTANYMWPKAQSYNNAYSTVDIVSRLLSDYNAVFRFPDSDYALTLKRAGDFDYIKNAAEIQCGATRAHFFIFHHIADPGTDISQKVYKVYIEIDSADGIKAVRVYKGSTDSASSVTFLNVGTAQTGIHKYELTINGSDIAAYSTYGYNLMFRVDGLVTKKVSIGRLCVVDITDGDRAVPVPIVTLDEHYKDNLRFPYLSVFSGKKLYTIGDSITYQEKWQGVLARLRNLAYQSGATRDATYPLGIGGATICPFVNVTTSVTTFPAVTSGGTPITDGNGNPLYFVIGKGPAQSIYYRADYLATRYTDADVIILEGGENDANNGSYTDLGQDTDAPYEGLQYVLPQYAVIAKHYANVAILNDGSVPLDPEYTGGNYTLITERPTFSACAAGTIKKLLLPNPSARLVACSIIRRPSIADTYYKPRYSRHLAMLAIYKRWGVPVANLWDEMGVNPYTAAQLLSDSAHPTALGGEIMANVISHIL